MKMFPIVLAGLLAAVVYVTWHLWRIAPGGWPVKCTVAGLFVLWMALSFASLGLSEKVPVQTAVVMQEIGMPWMIAFLYLLLVFLVADICAIFRILPKEYMYSSAIGLSVVLGVVAVLLAAGGIHYRHKYREDLTIHTSKPLEQPLTVVLASDLHVGYTNRRAELARWIDIINAAEPDLVLFGGDIIDMRLRPVVESGCAEEFRRLNAPAFAVTGNHEFYGDILGAERFYADAGITLLRDSVAQIKGVRIAGRDDLGNRQRLPLAALLPGAKPAGQEAQATAPAGGNSQIAEDGTMTPFTLLLDHQPADLSEAEEAGVDFQFSGHTHRGQVWPLSWVTDAIFEKSWGHHTRGGTQYYISSGLGIWGPKIRIGTRSEYLVLHIIPAAE